MAKYIDADLLRKEINKHYDEYKAKFHQNGERYYLGLIDGLDMAERIIDSPQQEQSSEDKKKRTKSKSYTYSFDVPDNDGYLIFDPMDNQTIRKVLKLKGNEGVTLTLKKDEIQD